MWRERLATLLRSLDDATLAQEAQSVCEDAATTEEAGRAMLTRVLHTIDVQDEAHGIPF